MPAQLDILALEPFYGGFRRLMLETLVRCSRHRWTLLKLPPRRIERRLSAASIWFAEQLQRHWVGRVDVLLVSEALNLADLFRLMPNLARKPSVVYFHANQLPDAAARSAGPFDMVNLNSAVAATEIWFNSLFHLRQFLTRATALVKRTPELSFRTPMPELTGKAQVVVPPIDFSTVHELVAGGVQGVPIQRVKRRVFVETRDADMKLLNLTLAALGRRAEKFELVTVGPVEELAEDLPRTTLGENDERAHVQALLGCGVFISARPDAPADHHAVKALAAGCWPIVPETGVYPEILPKPLHSPCLYDGTPDNLTGRMQDAFHLAKPKGHEQELAQILYKFDPATACKVIDQRLEELAIAGSAGKR